MEAIQDQLSAVAIIQLWGARQLTEDDEGFDESVATVKMKLA